MYLYRWSSSKDSVHIICRFHVKKLQACFPPGTDLSKGTPKIIDKASCVDVNGEVIIDEPADVVICRLLKVQNLVMASKGIQKEFVAAWSMGSGKSSFISCILREIPKISGEVRI
ncbi:uncharacterized protein LOC110886778 isoform X1 [Helianthus annuus]|uniref:uncharacterized protein LOC110886778 isoform X1 n=1 Tax=Helianthus annuus TaxID=4232 RepID=UPI000B90580B|nr:uncharacterized protein LOC110886778 isoform X1 [Helianthus annuus]